MFYGMFLLLGTIYLIILTVQDYRDMSVDSKYNYILLGLGLSLMTHITVSFWYVLALIISMVLFNWFGNTIKVFGKGDFSAFNWIFLGFAFIHPIMIIFFMLVLTFIGVIYDQLRVRISKKKFGVIKPVPFYPVILAAWLITLPLITKITPMFII